MASKNTATAQVKKLGAAVIASLTPELVKEEFQFLQKKHRLGGHCYVATEAMYYLLGGKNSGYMPASIVHEGVKHYYLKHRETGEVIDLTAAQFRTAIAYQKGRGSVYRQFKPSKRTATLLARVNNRLSKKKTGKR